MPVTAVIQSAAVGGDPAWEQVFNLAVADGWTADYVSSISNPSVQSAGLRVDGADSYWTTVPDALGNHPNIVQSTTGNQPQFGADVFGDLDAAIGVTAGRVNLLHDTTFTTINSPFVLTMLARWDGDATGLLGFLIRDVGGWPAVGKANSSAIFEQSSSAGNLSGGDVSGTHVYTSIYGSASASLRIDGVEVDTGDTGSTSMSRLTFLCRHNLSDRGWNGPSAGFLVREDTSNIAAMEDLLMTLAGI